MRNTHTDTYSSSELIFIKCSIVCFDVQLVTVIHQRLGLISGRGFGIHYMCFIWYLLKSTHSHHVMDKNHSAKSCSVSHIRAEQDSGSFSSAILGGSEQSFWHLWWRTRAWQEDQDLNAERRRERISKNQSINYYINMMKQWRGEEGLNVRRFRGEYALALYKESALVASI